MYAHMYFSQNLVSRTKPPRNCLIFTGKNSAWQQPRTKLDIELEKALSAYGRVWKWYRVCFFNGVHSDKPEELGVPYFQTNPYLSITTGDFDEQVSLQFLTFAFLLIVFLSSMFRKHKIMWRCSLLYSEPMFHL